MVGHLYGEKDPRRDSAFTIFYMGINLGALFAPLVIGLISDNIFAIKDSTGDIITYGYKYGFLAAAIGMFFGQMLFNTLSNRYLGEIGKKPLGGKKVLSAAINEQTQGEQKLTKVEKERISVIFIFFLFTIFFWAGFEQAGSSLTLYADRYIDCSVNLPLLGDFTIPTAWFQSINPLFIILLAPVFAAFWMTKFGQKISTHVKMGSGMIILGIGFFFMLAAVAQRGGDIEDTAVKASLWWMVLTYLLHTMGELCISPVGLSVVTKLSPPRLASLLMAVWFLSSSIANFIGGFLASYVETLGAGKIFLYISLFIIACGVLLLLLSKKVSKMMNGVK